MLKVRLGFPPKNHYTRPHKEHKHQLFHNRFREAKKYIHCLLNKMTGNSRHPANLW